MDNRLNQVCPECGKKFHACSGCGFIYDYEYEYCSEECYKKSLKYDEKKRKIIQLIKDSFNNIYRLDDLAIYLYENINREILIFLEEEDIQKEWYHD